MDSAFLMLCPKYGRPLSMADRLRELLPFSFVSVGMGAASWSTLSHRKIHFYFVSMKCDLARCIVGLSSQQAERHNKTADKSD